MMRVVSVVTLLAATLSLVTASSSAALGLTDAELTSIKAELVAWKASPVGQEARVRGYLASPTDQVTDDEIARFVNAKAAIARLQQDQPTARLSLDTPFALLTFDEFASRTGATSRVPLDTSVVEDFRAATNASTPPPQTDLKAKTSGFRAASTEAVGAIFADSAEVDWERYGCVSPVQHEGACNAGWVFAAVGSIETGYCVRSNTGHLYQLSKQDVLTCGEMQSCDHGVTPNAFDWIVNYNGGSVCTEASLPYTRADYEPRPCTRMDDPGVWCDKPDLQVASFVQNHFPNHQDLEAIVRERAVTAMIYLCPALQYYTGGVMRGDQNGCPTPTSWEGYKTHHDLLIVGFGTRNGVPYWKVKNSVGQYWGENGYGYIERGYQGHVYGAAGIEQWNTYPLFKWEMPSSFDSTRPGPFRYGIEILGADLKTVTLLQFTPNQCGPICRREPGCKAYVYDQANLTPVCRLKSSVDGERPAGLNIASAVLVSKQEVADGFCLTPENNVDFPGNDLLRTLAASAEECCDLCFSHANCNAYTWTQFHGGSCFMKKARAAKPQLQAPAPDGSAYFRSGVAYKCQALQFNADFPGNDLANLPAAGPMDCCGHCRAFSGICAGFSWTDFNGGTCWLKTKASNAVYAPGVFAAAV